MKDYYLQSELSKAKQLRDGLSAEQHVRRAEELLAGRLDGDAAGEWGRPPTGDEIAVAHVHATLAQALAALEIRAAVTVDPRIRPAVPR